MKKISLLLLLSIFTFITLSAQNIIGTWNGTLDVGVMKLSLVFHIIGDKDKLTARCPLLGGVFYLGSTE